MKSCAIIGHRKVVVTDDLKEKVRRAIINLITEGGVTDFLFGSRSLFTDLCYDIVTEIKPYFSNVVRVYVRAEYPNITDGYKEYLLSKYERSFFYNEKSYSSKWDYIKRNEYMISIADICLFYYDYNYIPQNNLSSGTKLSYLYAKQKQKKIINLFE